MARVTYAPVTGKSVGKTVGASNPNPTVSTMKPSVSNPIGSIPYQPPTPSPGTGFQGGPTRIPPTPTPPANGGTSGVSGNFNPSAPNPPSPGTGFQGGPVGGNNPPPSPGVGFQGGPVGGNTGYNFPQDPHSPIPNLGGKIPGGLFQPNDQVTPVPPNGFVVGSSIPPRGTSPNDVVVGGFNPPPAVSPPMNPITEPPFPSPVPNTNPNRIVGNPVTGTAPAVPPGGYAPISEPTLPVGYNPGGGVGGIATQPIGQPANNPAPFPETPIQSNADRAELAPPVGSWTKFTDKGKWSGQDAQAQNIANKRKAKKDTNDATPDTGTIVTPTVGKKKKTGATTMPPKQGGGNGASEASGTSGNKGNNAKTGKAGKNAKVDKAAKQKAKNRKPQPGTPARPYRNRGVSYKPLGYGGTLRI